MDYSTIQQRIWGGYARAALRIGPTYQWYRPVGSDSPVGAAQSLGTIRAAISTDASFKFDKGENYNKPLWFALVDGAAVQINDYITDGGANTWYVESLPPLQPIGVVNCNRVLTVSRPTSATGIGLLPYGGDVTEPVIMTAWPGSVLQGTRGEKGDTQLPGDVRLPWYEVLLPYAPGVQIKAFDVMTDEVGQRYRIASTERSNLGWRMTATLTQT